MLWHCWLGHTTGKSSPKCIVWNAKPCYTILHYTIGRHRPRQTVLLLISWCLQHLCCGLVPGDLDGRRIFANGEKAAEMFCHVEELIAANGTTSSAPFTWLFMRPPWATTGACCKECVFNTMKDYAVQVHCRRRIVSLFVIAFRWDCHLSPSFGLRPKISQKVKLSFHLVSVIAQLLAETERRIAEAKVNLHSSVESACRRSVNPLETEFCWVKKPGNPQSD